VQKPIFLLVTGYSVIILLLGILPLLPLIYALEHDTVEVSFAEIKPKIDGRFTSEAEWADASVTNFQSNGYDFYLLAKQDRTFVYLILDGVDFQTDPKSQDVSVRYQTTICFDANNDKDSQRQPGDFCHTSTDYNEFGRHTQTKNAPVKFDLDGEPSHLDLPYGFRYGWSFGSLNDQLEESNHLMYEARIPKKMLGSSDGVGFTFEMYFDSAHDDLVQLVDGVVWPSESQKEMPSTWGTLFLPQNQCPEDLELVHKTSSSSLCVSSQKPNKN
jgi:hypothetical protein